MSYKARNNTVIKRDDVIKHVASAVTMDGDYDHMVDLNNPDLTVVVEIIKVNKVLPVLGYRGLLKLFLEKLMS